MSFDVVVAADRAWGIGKANALPWPRLRGDLQHFRRVTSEASAGKRNAIAMGRKTWQSAEVAGKPLPKRFNVVISRNPLVVPDGVGAARSLDEALALARAASDVDTVFVVGGAEIFRIAFAHPALRYIYLTRIDGDFACDAHIPDVDALGFGRDAWLGEAAHEEHGVRFRIERLVRGG